MNHADQFRVLVVDDEASVLTTYRLILERQGYEVAACRTWLEAMAAIERQVFDAVLCDYSLENRHTGCEVIRAARQRKPGVPAALMTGYANKETADQASQSNTIMMYKPIEIEEFLDTVARMVRGENEVSREVGQKDSVDPQSAIADERGVHGSSARER